MSSEILTQATTQATAALSDLEQLLGTISDADLHRAEPNGGWTCAQLVTHIHLCSLLWIADVERLRLHPDTHMFMFREELGHDALGAVPISTQEAAARIANARLALERALPTIDAKVMAKSLEVPTLGTFPVATWVPLIIGHLAGHVEQIKAVLRSRGVIA